MTVSLHRWRRAGTGRSVRLPDPSRSAPERLLAEANERGRDDAIASISALLPGTDPAAMARRTDGATLSVSRRSDDTGFVPDPEGLLDRLVGDHDAGPGHLKVARDGASTSLDGHLEQVHPTTPGPGDEPIAMSTSRVPAGRLASILASAGTIVIDGVDLRDRHLSRLAELYERVFDCNVNINAYVSVRPHPGFGFHWDDHEVVILQMLGHKSWEVQEPVALSPNRLLHDTATTGRTVWKGRVEPGQVLHVPRGWGHDATGADELTFHLTVSIPRLDGLQAVNFSLLATDDSDRRRDLLDVSLGAPTPSHDDVRRTLREAVSPAGIDRAAAAYRSNILSRPTQSMSTLLLALDGERDVWVRSCHGGGVMWGEGGGAEPTICYGRRTHTTSVEALTFLAPLLDGRARSVAEVEHRSTDPTLARAWIDEALLAGLLETTDPDDWGVTAADER